MLKTQRWRLALWMLAAIGMAFWSIAAPDQAVAAPVPSQTASTTAVEAGTRALAAERALIQARLVGFGLTQSAAASRVAVLTDEEVHAIAADPDSLQAAGGSNAAGVAVVVLIVAVVVALKIFGDHMPPD